MKLRLARRRVAYLIARREIEGLWWPDLRATFCTRLALAGYEALTIMILMGHKELKTTMRYIRAVQLQRNVSSHSFVYKLVTQAVRPPMWQP
ncbi:MAG: tyrosine-type recombinase/integrase [Pyrinomonadaceae bacterium]